MGSKKRVVEATNQFMKTTSLFLSILLFAGCQNMPDEKELYPIQSPFSQSEIGQDYHVDYIAFVQFGNNQDDALIDNIKQVNHTFLPYRIIKKEIKRFESKVQSWLLIEFLIPNKMPEIKYDRLIA